MNNDSKPQNSTNGGSVQGNNLRQQAAKETATAIKHIAAATHNEDVNLPVMVPLRWHNSRRSREAEYARVILHIDRHNTVKPKPRKGLIGRILSFFR